jgi:outer membrane phospholipase A
MTVIGSDFIFIHVPKCAGKSLSKRLGGVTKGVPGHAPLSYFSPEVRKDRLAFGFVRNPWDRMVSAYTFITTKSARPADDAEHRELARSVGFKRWLMETELYYRHEDRVRETLLLPFQKRSQMFWLEGCDFIGQTENIDADFREVEARIARSKSIWYKLRFSNSVERRNFTQRRDYRSYYDEDSAAFVARFFAPEIKRFKYSFDPEA